MNMARKSRKNIIENATAVSKIYKAAAYLRLSVVKNDVPSDSIENQLCIIKDFIEINSDIEFTNCYIDTNASGGNFKRQGFQQMLQDIESKKIDCVIVKDLSRFGRNHIEMGFYLEKHFPAHGVRFISVNEGWDSIDGIIHKEGEKGQLKAVPLNNLINEAFLIDIRKKTQFSIDLQIAQGGFVAPRAPYGYQKARGDCHQLEIDEPAAAFVRHIFDMASQRMGVNEMVRRLNIEQIPTPVQYAIANGLTGNYEQGNGLWNTRSVKKILTNITYTGVLVQGKNNTLVKNTHEAIISKELFAHVQTMSDRKETQSATPKALAKENVLKGKVICGICGGKMQRKKGSGGADWHFFTCITKNRMGAEHCSGMYIRESKVMAAIQRQFDEELLKNIDKNTLSEYIPTHINSVTIIEGKQVSVELL